MQTRRRFRQADVLRTLHRRSGAPARRSRKASVWREREELESKARQAETAAHIEGWLRSPELFSHQNRCAPTAVLKLTRRASVVWHASLLHCCDCRRPGRADYASDLAILDKKASKFDPHKFKDKYEAALKALVKRKAAGKTIEVPEEKQTKATSSA
ncbi:hypothetical protein J2S34_002270 [Nitrobacter winogradskyi]|uniref:Uncharacterized protein n=1 Tax=Nitrobacter winogradskyi TaxID=913 RepID=A0ACC6AJW0_NITWI|nr:hypothetical protein [Nitrobacter winogradskyi]